VSHIFNNIRFGRLFMYRRVCAFSMLIVTFVAYHVATAMDTEKKSTSVVYAMAYRQGDENQYEDRYFVRRGGSPENMKGHTIMSLFDGCGGKLVSGYAQQNLARTIWQKIVQVRAQNEQVDIKNLFADSFKQLNEKILADKAVRCQDSTCLVVYIDNLKAYIGCIGNTRAIIMRNGKVIFSTVGNEADGFDIAAGYDDSDCEYDDTSISSQLSVGPAVKTVDLCPQDLVLLATTGVWSAMSNHDVAAVVCQTMQAQKAYAQTLPQAVINRSGVREEYGENGAHRDAALLHVARVLRDRAYAAGSQSNITAIAAAIREQGQVDGTD
jgi:serine/threonine protein phosphatase PrpC